MVSEKTRDLYYYQFGMNVNSICGNTIEQRNKYKAPSDSKWEDYLDIRMPEATYQCQDWNNATGIGLILGYNDYRAFDIDGIDFYSNESEKEQYVNSFPTQNPILEQMLRILGLPEDYEWVTFSGSLEGIHIIFRVVSPMVNLPFRTKAYEGKCFSRLEFRWRDYLVLPPSIHESGYSYKFRFGTFPSYQPHYVSLDNVFDFINQYCGTNITSLVHLNINHEYHAQDNDEVLLRRKVRVFSGDWSGSTPPSSDSDEFMLFRHCTSPDALNYIGVEYSIGRFVKQNMKMAGYCFEHSHTADAHINLAQLIAGNYISGTREEMWYHAERGTRNARSYIFDYLYNTNVLKVGEQRYLFIDTETLGLPSDFSIPPSDFENWPRMIQLSWIVTDEFGTIIDKYNRYVYPDDFIIPQEIAKLTGITTELAREKGQIIYCVLDDFKRSLEACDMIIGHNLDFDKKVIEAEAYRTMSSIGTIILEFKEKAEYCTMKHGANICKIQSSQGYKYPKLYELYQYLFGKSFENTHDAQNDVYATMQCYFEMIKKEKTLKRMINDELPF